MRVVIQRVSRASVTVDQNITGEISLGLLVLVGIEDADTDDDIRWLSNKIVNLRIFNDADGVMNCSIKDIRGEPVYTSRVYKKRQSSELYQGKQTRIRNSDV
jgi:D-tyrosyl-tRNA(Tyr) deacylase